MKFERDLTLLGLGFQTFALESKVQSRDLLVKEINKQLSDHAEAHMDCRQTMKTATSDEELAFKQKVRCSVGQPGEALEPAGDSLFRLQTL